MAEQLAFELTPFEDHAGPVAAVTYSPDGATLASANVDGAVRLWDATNGKRERTLSGHTGRVWAVAYSPDGGTLASAGVDGTVQLWDPTTGERGEYLINSGRVRAVAYSPDGGTLASAGVDGRVQLWDPATGEHRRALTGHTGPVLAVAYSPNGSTLATAGADGTLRLWDPTTGRSRRTLSADIGAVWAVAYSPDGGTLASGGADGTVQLWDPATGEHRRTMTGHTGEVFAVPYSSDGTTLASGAADGTVQLWDATTGRRQRTMTGHTGPVRAVAYSPDGATLASGSEDGTLRAWNPHTGQQIGGYQARGRSRALAGVRSDRPSDDDLLDFADDVETLTALVAAVDTEPPLAIAILGDWGTGKSSFMQQMQARVQLLADLSVNSPGLSSFAANIRQIKFNAWHYSDDTLWSGIVEHLFLELARPQPSSTSDDSVSAVASVEREKLHARAKDLRTADGQLTTGLIEFGRARRIGPLGQLRSPTAYAKLALTATRALLHDMRTWIAVLSAWLLVFTVAFGVWLWISHRVAGIVAALCGVLAPVAVVIARLHLKRTGQGVTAQLLGQIERRQREVREDLAQATARLAELDAAVRLSQFLTTQSKDQPYQVYRGLLGHVHRDLTQLDNDLRTARKEWEVNPSLSPPIERIILYIDDLDRCPPKRVVEVLAAVNLMLSLPLFIVVVAVDPRWLLRSLDHHHAELFADHDPGGLARLAFATPLDYLDKIFQIPFAVASLTRDAAERYVAALVQLDLPPQDVAGEPPREDPMSEERLPSASPEIAGGELAPKPEPPEFRTDQAAESTMGGPGSPLAARAPVTTEPQDIAQSHAAAAAPDLRPEGLQLTPAEVDLLPHISPLLSTPRAAKKLVNLYRLIRISIKDADLAAFLNDGPSRMVLTLLALIVGAPSAARTILTAILSASPDTKVIDLLAAPTVPGVADEQWSSVQQPRQVLNEILCTIQGANDDVAADYPEWCRAVARFSFYTRDLAARAIAPDSIPTLKPDVG